MGGTFVVSVPAPPSRDEEPRVKAVLPVHSESFKDFLRNIRAWLEIRVRERTLGVETADELQKLVDIAMASVIPWLSEAGVIVSIADPEAFKRDVRRKMIGIAETLRNIVIRSISACTEAIESISNVERQILQGELSVEMSRYTEVIAKSVQQCMEVSKTGRRAMPAFLLAIDVLLGAVQSNLPASLMPNTIKGRVGFFTD